MRRQTGRSRRNYLKYKEVTRTQVLARLLYFNQFYGLKYNRVAIRNQRGRWGSCSSKGNLNFNYRLIFLPPELFDYVIVHELCHLQELNHSEKFWQLVERTLPRGRVLAKQLRRYSMSANPLG